MKNIFLNLTSALVLGLSFAASGCDPRETEVPVNNNVVQQAPPVAQPTGERLMERARSRWKKIEAGGTELVAAYDFAAPDRKKLLKLSDFLSNMDSHRYENMRVLEIVALEKDKGYVRIDGLWTPIGPKVAAVKLEAGQTLTQPIQMIETWRWVDGDWAYVSPHRENEFFEEHPELLKAKPAESAAAKGTEPAK